MSQCDFKILQAIRLKMVEASPDAQIVINRKRHIVDMNEEAEFLFGYARGELIGKNIDVLLPEEVRETHDHHISSFFKSPRRREMGIGKKLEAINRDNEKFVVQIRLAPIVIEGEDGGVFGLAVIRRAE